MSDDITIQHAEHAGEGGHWYDPATRQLVTGVPDAKGKRLVKPTLVHARKFGLVPGATTIANLLKSPGLTYYREDSLLDAALTLPVIANEPADTRKRRVRDDAEAHATHARNEGTVIHTVLHRYAEDHDLMDYDKLQQLYANVVKPVEMPDLHWLYKACGEVGRIERELGGRGVHVVACEQGFATHEFGGTIDRLWQFPDGSRAIVDFKGIEPSKLVKYHPYDEYGYQLAGYGFGLGWTPVDRYFNIAIARGLGLCAVYEWRPAKMVQNFAMFRALLHVWQVKNRWEEIHKED